MSWAESIKWAKCRKGKSSNGSLKCERRRWKTMKEKRAIKIKQQQQPISQKTSGNSQRYNRPNFY